MQGIPMALFDFLTLSPKKPKDQYDQDMRALQERANQAQQERRNLVCEIAQELQVALNTAEAARAAMVLTLPQQVRLNLVTMLSHISQRQDIKGLDYNQVLSDANKLADFVLKGELPSATVATLHPVRVPLSGNKQ